MMRARLTVRQFSVLVVAAVAWFSSVAPARAQGFISPFYGYNFGGDSGCPNITNCEDKHANWGVGLGALGSFVGFELEFAHTNDFFGSSPTQSTSVLTMMGNFMLAPKFGPIQPYGVGGLGLIRTSVEGATDTSDQNQFGYDIGGGLIGYFSQHVGARGDVRYFHSFDVLDLSRFPSINIGQTKLDFGRFSVGVVFKF